jgi:hypothetical protein
MEVHIPACWREEESHAAAAAAAGERVDGYIMMSFFWNFGMRSGKGQNDTKAGKMRLFLS